MRLFSMLLSALAAVAVAATVGGCSAEIPSPSGANSPSVTASPVEPSVRLLFEEAGQFELIAASGQDIFIDCTDPGAFSRPAGVNDILLTTSGHHIDSTYLDAFPGKKLTKQAGTINAGDITIVGVAASHNPEAIDVANPTNAIYVISVAGLRIAVFGEIGQAHLTPDQLAALGRVDVLISQLANTASQMDAENKNGLTLVNEARPRLFVPTYLNMETAGIANDQWKGVYSTGTEITLRKSMLPTETTFVVMGTTASSYAGLLKLTEVTW
jgi:hypothetical protein